MIELNDKTWNDFISKNEKVLVDVYGADCAPCRRMEPILMDAESLNLDRVAFAKIEGIMNMDSVAQYGIRAVPTLLYFKSGKLIHRETGFRNLDEIQDGINKHLL
jgi:thioredoxin-like negative regulator of GroEL